MQEKKKKNMILHHTENSYKNKRQNLEVKLMWKMKKLLVDIMALDLKKKKGQAKHIWSRGIVTKPSL